MLYSFLINDDLIASPILPGVIINANPERKYNALFLKGMSVVIANKKSCHLKTLNNPPVNHKIIPIMRNLLSIEIIVEAISL